MPLVFFGGLTVAALGLLPLGPSVVVFAVALFAGAAASK
jgi:hypothetical protein